MANQRQKGQTETKGCVCPMCYSAPALTERSGAERRVILGTAACPISPHLFVFFLLSVSRLVLAPFSAIDMAIPLHL